MDKKWHAFVANNSQPMYGFGTTSEAEQFCEFLDRDHVNRHYHYRDLTAHEFTKLDDGYDGFRLDEELDWIAHHRHLYYAEAVATN
jgi:hypothetical protein